jgi:hypothetical protein
MKAHRGTLVLILGILSLICCGLLGIPAWIMGNSDLKEMSAGTMDSSGQGITNAGKICGIVGTILGALQLLALLVYALILMGLIASFA